MNFLKLLLVMSVLLLLAACFIRTNQNPATVERKKLRVGADRFELYRSRLQRKKVGVVVNQTSVTKGQHLVDFLLAQGVKVTKIFSPEHGFRGNASAGEKVKSSVDSKTSLPIISLYGNRRKPFPEDLKDLDVVLFDIQDVGLRFYTYISTMHLVMEACAENRLPFIVLDRPNPHGNEVAGPVRDDELKSFVGMHPIPIVYGMTMGELAKMVNEQGWLANKVHCDLTVVPLENWQRDQGYSLPIKPSPNLPNDRAIALYSSLCLFEGTTVSVGRGTSKPFQHYGHPNYPERHYFFVPLSNDGAKNPKHKEKKCFGVDLSLAISTEKFTLRYLIDCYKKMGRPKDFFIPFFDKLSGDKDLKKMIIDGKEEVEIAQKWQIKLNQFKILRSKYLIY